VAIFNLMEDRGHRGDLARAAGSGCRTGPSSRRQASSTAPWYEKLRDEELAKLPDSPQLKQARRILDDLVLGEFVEFLTLPAYEQLE